MKMMHDEYENEDEDDKKAYYGDCNEVTCAGVDDDGSLRTTISRFVGA